MDLHGDGNKDLISGSWPGEIFIFRGGPGRTFAPPEMIKDRNGEPINIGGCVRESDGELIVFGSADYESKPDGSTIVKFHGKTFTVAAGKSWGMSGTASAVHAFDWNGDGAIDLLVGTIRGDVWLVPNEGTKAAPAFGKPTRLEAGGKPIDVKGDAGPFVADWDGDGLPDLLVGAGDGSVTFFKNVGTREKPVLAAGEVLVPPSPIDYQNPPAEPRRGVRAKVCAVDWTGSGRLDLLVGDITYQRPLRAKQTPDELAREEKLRQEVDALTKKLRELHVRRRTTKDPAERQKLGAEIESLREKMSALREKLPSESEDHGWVWLFKRKPKR